MELLHIIWVHLPSGPWDFLVKVGVRVINFGYKVVEMETEMNKSFNIYDRCFDVIHAASNFICDRLPGKVHTFIKPKYNPSKKRRYANHLCNYRLHWKMKLKNHCKRGLYRGARRFREQKKYKTVFPNYGTHISFLSILPVTTYYHQQRRCKQPRAKQNRSNKHKQRKPKRKEKEEKDYSSPPPINFTDWFKNRVFYLWIENIIQLSYQHLSHWKLYCLIQHYLNYNFIQICFCITKIFQVQLSSL